jgi:hypothetical protein
MAALSANCDGVHFDCSHVYASGNLAADMYASIAAKHRRQLAVRLFDARRSRACGKMLSFLLAPDPMHQQQPLAAIEDIGGRAALPFPIASIAPRQRRNSLIWSWEANAECRWNLATIAKVRLLTARERSNSERSRRSGRSPLSGRQGRTRQLRPCRWGNRPSPSRSSESVKIPLLRGSVLFGPRLKTSAPQHSSAYLHHTRIMIFGVQHYSRPAPASEVPHSAKLQRFLRSEPTILIDGATRSCVYGACPSGEHR